MSQDAAFSLDGYPCVEGIHHISPPQSFDGGEDAYDAQIGGAGNPDLLRPGRGAHRLIARHITRPLGDLLELGAGGGTCTLGLLAGVPELSAVITDTSPAFLQLLRRKLAAAGIAAPRTRYATLAGEDLHRLPAASFDAVVIASALHHVWDWRACLAQAARVLRPGGVLAIQEPCREGNLMMAMALDVVLSPLWPQSLQPDAQDRQRLQTCRDSIYYLADTRIEKQGEDKHSFLANELTEAGEAAGFSASYFYSNLHFADIAGAPDGLRRGRASLLQYFDSFLQFHHRISAPFLAVMRENLYPVFGRLDDVFRGGDGAPLLGCMVFRR